MKLRCLFMSIAVCFLGNGLLLGPQASGQEKTISPDEQKFFETKIRPVLIKECYGCHSDQGGNVRGGLRLDTAERSLIGGESGPAIVPGDLDESLLWSAINHDDFVMPPKRKLDDDVIADFRRWIEMGAPDPRTKQIGEIQSSITSADIAEARETYWAYQAPQRHAAPAVNDTAWPTSDVDQFILAKLEKNQLTPAPDASAATLIRRLCFDLIGLPPTPLQISIFEKRWQEDPQQAIQWAVDRLLEKEEFGQRWGRHWLDVARYAESSGREVNMTFPHAWRYRDFVIKSFNQDKPFNQFVMQQIAGDLLPVSDDEQWTENLIATTFLAIGPKNLNEQNRIQFAADLVDEQVDATTRVFLASSVACARCHDHKFDAIPQSDYYALAGIFANTKTYFGNPPSSFGAFRQVQQRQDATLLRLPIDDPNPFDKRYSESELADLRAELASKLNDISGMRRNAMMQNGSAANAQAQRIRLNNELADLSNKLSVVDENGQPISYCMGAQDRLPARDIRLLVRGEIDAAAQTVARGFPQAMCEQQPDLGESASGRLELARWIASDDNPLTARVFVNRVWKHLFGQGLVTSTENFGVTGTPPSHPELLDDLAKEFMESGWSTKTLISKLVNTHLYRSSSQFNQSAHQQDPDNRLLWRIAPKRLEAEAIRDAMLHISDQIDLSPIRGSEVAKAGYVRVRNGMLTDPRASLRKVAEQQRAQFTNRMRGGFGRNRGERLTSIQRQFQQDFSRAVEAQLNQLDMVDAKCRSVYLPIVRDEEPHSLVVFDLADTAMVTGARETSNTAGQALYLLNNDMVIRQSEAFADRLMSLEMTTAERIDRAFVMTVARHPTTSERTAAVRFLKSFADSVRSASDAERDAWIAFCQSLFATAEFRYLD